MTSSICTMNQNHTPLVSIIVITYNSSKYLLETLESANDQTYQNLELIVTDDCSTDNTVDICRKWIKKNKKRFIRTKIVLSPKNTGIAANCNRGLKEAEGEWLKFIAGDDLLNKSCINDCIEYINNSYHEIEIVCGRIKAFRNKIDLKDSDDASVSDQDSFYAATTSQEQHRLLLKSNKVPAPAVFLKKSFLASMNGFDERYPMLEDHPLWLKATECGIKIYSFWKITTFYRIHNESVSNATSLLPYIVNPFYIHYEKFEKDYVYSRLNYIQRFERKYRYARYRIIVCLGNNANNYFLRYLNKMLELLDPASLWTNFVKK